MYLASQLPADSSHDNSVGAFKCTVRRTRPSAGERDKGGLNKKSGCPLNPKSQSLNPLPNNLNPRLVLA